CAGTRSQCQDHHAAVAGSWPRWAAERRGGAGPAVRRAILWIAVACLACESSTGPNGPVADVAGVWSYSGTQTLPALSLSGTLNISRQSRDVIEGSLGWSETDGVSVPVLKSGSLAGVVVGTTDVDFDVAVDGVSRRHLA